MCVLDSFFELHVKLVNEHEQQKAYIIIIFWLEEEKEEEKNMILIQKKNLTGIPLPCSSATEDAMTIIIA